MPIPTGQSCANCQAFFLGPAPRSPREDLGECRIDQPAASLKSGDWPIIGSEKWCNRWVPISGSSSLGPYKSGFGYRGHQEPGDTLTVTTAWSLLTPTFASITTAINFSVTSSGLITYSNPNMAGDAVVSFNITGICGFRSASNQDEIIMTMGVNGVADEDRQMAIGIRNLGVKGPVPVNGQLGMSNGDTIGLYIKTNSLGFTGSLENYNFTVVSDFVVSFGT